MRLDVETPQWHLEMIKVSADTLITALERLTQRTQPSHAQIPDLQTVWENKCFKPQSYGVICYAVIDH